MGGRGYHNDVNGYLHSNKRTADYIKIPEISTESFDFLIDKENPIAPTAPEFSNTAGKTYILINKLGTGIKNITVYDSNHEQSYTIHLDHNHKGTKGPHVHLGFNKSRKEIPLTEEHKRMIKYYSSIFENWRKGK